ncbi:hypothetical protein L6R52_15860 [Myxococcota bacterium]|nr:hypothetical protein [Myxococcota bacterium]
MERRAVRAAASVAALAVVGSSACLRVLDLALPDAPEGTKTAIFVETSIDAGVTVVERAEVFAWDAALPIDVARVVRSDTTLMLLYFTSTPGALDLPVGQLELATEDRETHEVPTAAAAWVADRGAGAWSPLDAASAPRLVVRARDAEACLRARGCFVDGRCASPCPSDVRVMPPSPPRAAERPAWTCAPGWRAQAAPRAGAVVCAPDLADEDCPVGQALFLGAHACTAVGGVCPAGDHPEPPASGTALYVSAGAAPGGTGTPTSPFTTIQAAISAAPATGATILVAAGRYTGELGVLPGRSIRVVGVCAERVELTGSVVVLPRAELAMSNFRIVAGPGVDRTVETQGVLALDHVEVVGGRLGVEVLARSSATLEHVAVRDQRTGASGAASIAVFDTGALVARDVSVSGSEGDGVLAVLGTIDVERAVVRRTAGRAFVVDRGRLVGASLVAARPSGAGLALIAGDASIDGLAILSSVDASGALVVGGAGTATITRALLAENERSILISGSSNVRLGDALVVDTRGAEASVTVAGDATLDLERVVVDGWTSTGLIVEAAHLRARDVTLHGCDFGTCADAIYVSGGSLALAAAEVRATAHHGVFALGARVELEDVTFADLRATRVEYGDSAVRVGRGATLLAARVLVERSPIIGIDLQGDARGRVEDLVARGTHGGAIATMQETSLDAARIAVSDMQGPAIVIGDALTPGLPDAAIVDLSVVGGRGGAGAFGAAGVLTAGPVNVDVARFSITDVEGPGLRVDRPTVRAREGEISGTTIGIELIGPDAALAPLLDRVKVADDVDEPLVVHW